MQESVINLGAFGFWIFLAVIAAAATWAHIRKQQIRKDLIQAMLEKGQAVDVGEVDRLLAVPPTGNLNENMRAGHRDPRGPQRMASFIFFLGGFATLFVAFHHEPKYWLALLAALPLFLAVSVWHTADKELANGSLATLKHKRDPREPWQHGGGWFFWIGYGTLFIALNGNDLNLPLVLLGLASLVISFRIWAAGNREYAEGRIPVNVPEPGDKTD